MVRLESDEAPVGSFAHLRKGRTVRVHHRLVRSLTSSRSPLTRRGAPVRRPALTAAAACLLVAAVVAAPAAAEGQTAAPVPTQKVLGGGSSYAALLIDQWRFDTSFKPYSLDINYQAIGSTQGRQAFSQGTIDFAGSDIPYQPEDQAVPAAGTFRYIPAVAGVLGMMFNLVDSSGNRVTNLRLDARQVCRIFTEPLSKPLFWDDPEIVALPGQPSLPHNEIKPVVRADGAGTSFVLSEYCIATAPDVWAAFRTAALANPSTSNQAMQEGRPVSNWPVGGKITSAPQPFGIANTTSATLGSITYIEAGFADITGLPLASVCLLYTSDAADE